MIIIMIVIKFILGDLVRIGAKDYGVGVPKTLALLDATARQFYGDAL